MANRKYTPRRAGKRWREGAPDYILDCFDDPRFPNDRYTVFYDLSQSSSGQTGNWVDTWLSYLAVTESGAWHSGEMRAYEASGYRYANGRHRVRWLDLPEAVRRSVAAWAEMEDS